MDAPNIIERAAEAVGVKPKAKRRKASDPTQKSIDRQKARLDKAAEATAEADKCATEAREKTKRREQIVNETDKARKTIADLKKEDATLKKRISKCWADNRKHTDRAKALVRG